MAWAGVFLNNHRCARVEYSGALAVPTKTLTRKTDAGVTVPASITTAANRACRRMLRRATNRDHQSQLANERIKLDVRDLNFYYGKFQALKISILQMRRRRSPRFIGPSGCGNRRCCAFSTVCTSCIRSSAPKARSASRRELPDVEKGRGVDSRQDRHDFPEADALSMSIYRQHRIWRKAV
jgi:hypothetical protein